MVSSPDGSLLRTHLNRQGPTTVLHVDDDPEFADLVAIYLEREGDSVEVVSEDCPESALERLETDHVDCVVSDYDMPGTDGLEFLEAVRADYPDLPFILFTGKGSEEIASDAISAGVTDYLQKDDGTEQYTVLVNRIENAVEQYRATQEVERGFYALETAREGVSFLDEEGTFLYVNSAYADTFGYERSELLGEHWEILYPEESIDQIHDEILPSVPVNDRWSGENVCRRKDGTRVVVNHALSYTEEGVLLCLIQDITEQKRQADALRQERRRFEEFVNAVEEYAIFTLDTEGFVTSWNRGAERLKGYTQSEIVGQHFSTFYPETKADPGYPEELLETALADGAVTDRGVRIRADGSEFQAEATITAVFDDDGTHRGFIKVTRHVTDRDPTAGVPDTEDDVLVRALDTLDDIFYLLDAGGSVVHVGDRATDITGRSREELLATSPIDLFAAEDQPLVRETIEETIATGSTRIEARLVTDDGRTVPFEFRGRRLRDEEGRVYVVGVGRDISERKRRERQLEGQLSQFQHFGDVLSHDIRTPLTTAQGRLELARETGADDHLDAAERALERLDGLITDLSNVMREGELVVDVTAVELAATLRGVWAGLDTAAATLTVETDAAVRADAAALERIVENLFKNAVDHAGDDVNVTVGRLPDGFYVEDDGPGIPADERERIFEAGYSTKDGSHGFGMASVRQIVVAHGWEIAATDAEDGGARFEITGVEDA